MDAQVPLEDQDLMDLMVSMVDQVRMETVDLKVYQDHVVYQEQWEQLDPQVPQEFQDFKVDVDLKERREQLV